ncbi:hypothetical protein Smic_58390 [Streptomyces microflavus]|uniref:Uncharacterized protein n=1 Tax=Streptomyces microflavus TaxID=1919 RepID=A0A7J0CXW1_STRMI|nr:hypothetical protein Smic_58390 [Streptomyces microflavus]
MTETVWPLQTLGSLVGWSALLGLGRQRVLSEIAQTGRPGSGSETKPRDVTDLQGEWPIFASRFDHGLASGLTGSRLHA